MTRRLGGARPARQDHLRACGGGKVLPGDDAGSRLCPERQVCWALLAAAGSGTSGRSCPTVSAAHI